MHFRCNQGKITAIISFLCLCAIGLADSGRLTKEVESIHSRPTFYSFSYEVLQSRLPTNWAVPDDIGLLGAGMHFRLTQGLYWA